MWENCSKLTIKPITSVKTDFNTKAKNERKTKTLKQTIQYTEFIKCILHKELC